MNMSTKIETNAGESIEVPTYAFLIFDVSGIDGVNQVLEKTTWWWRVQNCAIN